MHDNSGAFDACLQNHFFFSTLSSSLSFSKRKMPPKKSSSGVTTKATPKATTKANTKATTKATTKAKAPKRSAPTKPVVVVEIKKDKKTNKPQVTVTKDSSPGMQV